ncbi:hypothetical protein [Gemmiger sp. An50]|uniref:hypothetical protein n=1 Tax=Gemmiger sp. An50 TaxID=1965639 RepID=UPI000B371722|nr:hypothetical protein [Gemmiger sp. An50]OUN82924.1 hypothetical protein B5G03_16170 [Gemmiger sp. An50]
MATIYICKCGRRVRKSTNADNTGNRDTAGCRGCPYLLPWGPTQWDAARHAMVTDVKGYECRMSPSLDYATYYQGGGEDKCVLHIYSLDYDFLDRVTAWAAKQFPDKEISCSFDRSKIRATEFIGGLYGMSVYPMQNKKGMAAKAALIERFFGPDGHRLDKNPEEEKAHILAAIEAGKAKAQERKENMDYIISKHEATGRLYAYYKGSFWFWDSHIQRWLLSQFAEDLYQEERPKRWNFEREHFLAQTSDFHQLDDYEVPSRCIEALLQCNPKAANKENLIDSPCASSEAGEDTNVPTSSAAATAAAEETVAAPKPSDLASMMAVSAAKTNAEVVDATNKVAASSNLPDVCRDCQCATCGNEGCASHCWENPREVGDCEITGPAGDACRDYRPKEDVQCQKENAPSAAAAATLDESAARMCEGPDEETRTTPAAASGAALESLHAQSALPQNAPAQDIAADAPSAQAFDYSGLDAETAERLQNLARRAMEAKQRYVLDLMEVVTEAHRELVARCDKQNNQHSENTFRAWCASIGVGKDTAYRLLQVQALMDGSTPEEQEALADAPVKLLYAAAKPSAPAELVQAVKDGDITTHKQFKELEAKLKAEREAREKAEREAEDFKKRSEDAHKAANTYHCQYEEANAQKNALLDKQGAYIYQVTAAEQRAEEAERRARAAEEDAAEKDKRIRELETGRPQTIEATVVERIRMPEMAEEDAAELTTNLAASVTTVQRSFFMAAAAMAPQVKARCANTLWDTVNELATLLAASANPSYEEEEATPFD